jgi:hypothetical protein
VRQGYDGSGGACMGPEFSSTKQRHKPVSSFFKVTDTTSAMIDNSAGPSPPPPVYIAQHNM